MVYLENNNPLIWKYLRRGDTVIDEDDSVWGRTLFVIENFHGNSYLPEITVRQKGKSSNDRKHMCNLCSNLVRLVDSDRRQLERANIITLKKLITNGNIEAKRELIIRVNRKKYNL